MTRLYGEASMADHMQVLLIGGLKDAKRLGR